MPNGGLCHELACGRYPRLSGLSRQHTNQCLKELEQRGLLHLKYASMTIVDLEGLLRYGEH